MPLHVAGNLRRDTWDGRDRRELVIEDVADPRKLRVDDRFGDSLSRSDWRRGRSVPIYASCAKTTWAPSPVLASRRGCRVGN